MAGETGPERTGPPDAAASPRRIQHGIYYVYGSLGLLVNAILAIGTWGDWSPWVVVSGALLAWGAYLQGLEFVKESVFSLELGIYLFVYLCFGLWDAILVIFLCSVFTAFQGMYQEIRHRCAVFFFRKIGNSFVLGVSLWMAVAAYLWVGAPEHPVELSGRVALGFLLFWFTFTVFNNLLLAPIEIAEDGWIAVPRLVQETAIDGLLHGLSVLVGAGFALIHLREGPSPLYLLFPVFVLIVVILKRLTEQEKRLRLQFGLLKKLNETGTVLHQSLDLREVLEGVGRMVRELFSVETYFVALFDERTGKVQVALAVDLGKELAVEDFDPDQGLTGIVLRSGQPLFVEDVQKKPEIRGRRRAVGDSKVPARSIMMAPLQDKGRAIGVFSVQSEKENAFKPFHRELFLSVIYGVSTAVVSARLYKRATEDGLTRLYNKSYFEERVQECLQRGQTFGLLFFDCDDFKVINDRFGHLVGDRYLAALGSQIQSHCRAEDVPCRYGGDEFALLLPGTGSDQTRRVGERVMAAVDALKIPVEDCLTVGTTVSMGILWSAGNTPDLPVDDVLRRVDQSLYRAKRSKHSIEETTL